METSKTLFTRKITDENIKLIIDVEADDVDTSDYPDFSDAFVCEAWWSDLGRYLSDDELEQLSDDYPDFCHQAATESIY